MRMGGHFFVSKETKSKKFDKKTGFDLVKVVKTHIMYGLEAKLPRQESTEGEEPYGRYFRSYRHSTLSLATK